MGLFGSDGGERIRRLCPRLQAGASAGSLAPSPQPRVIQQTHPRRHELARKTVAIAL